MMNATELQAKAVKAAEAFLARKDFELVDANWRGDNGGHVDIVAVDAAGTLVFFDVNARQGADKGFIETEGHERARMETDAAKWLAEHADGDYVDCAVRFDVISMLVVGENRALLRHNVNCFGAYEGC